MAENRFEMMRDYWRQRFLEMDQEGLIRRFNLVSDNTNLYITYYCQPYQVDRATGTIRRCDRPNEDVPFSPLMSIYHLFCYSKPGAANSGVFVPFREVKGAAPFAPAFEKTIAEGLARPFEGHLEMLQAASAALNGMPVSQGDAGYIFHAFECMPVKMVFWDGDDEFPAQANLLFDRNITDFTHEETVCCVAEDLMRRLREEAKQRLG